jgi:hypothetical protein
MSMPMSVLSVALAQRISLAFGALYVLIGVLGFTPAVTYPAEGAGQGLLLGVFAVNPVHNLAHLALGGLMVWAGLNRPQWDMLTKTLAVVFLLLVGASFVAPWAEGIAINLPDTVLHAGTALVFGYFATKVPEDDFVPTR